MNELLNIIMILMVDGWAALWVNNFRFSIMELIEMLQ